jgi:hypothetical protein
MSIRRKLILSVCIGLALSLIPARNGIAVEGGLGRPISGAAINPYAGLVPPLPGFDAALGEIYYSGSIGGGTTVPIGINLTLGVDLKASFTTFSLLYIWPTDGKEWNFASGITFPLAYVKAEADVTVGRRTGRVKDDNFGLFDLVLVPVIASYHISQTDHVAFGLTIWTNTGEYDKDRLANLSTNTWTFIPNVAYTKLWPKCDVEFSAIWSATFDTEDNATHYQNGILSDLEATVIKRFKNGFGLGAIGSWIQQLTDDEGTTADRLNGFSGRAFGVGPIVTYSKKIGKKSDLELSARYIHEFENEKRVEGDLFTFSASFKF